MLTTVITFLSFCCVVSNLLVQDPLETIIATIIGPALTDEWVDGCFGCDCSLGCAVGWKVTASSSLKPEFGNSYLVGNLQDYRAKTAWVEGDSGYGIGEFILYKFLKEGFTLIKRDSINFDGFIIMNGYFKNEKTWMANSRVKTLKIYHNNKPLYLVNLHDSMSGQDAQFTKPIYVKPDDEIKMEIVAVFPGTKYKDTAISALIPMGGHR